MSYGRTCIKCNNPTNDPTGYCWRHRNIDTGSMSFLTKPGNEELLKLKLIKMIVEEQEGEEEFERYQQVELEGLPPTDSTPRYAIYHNRRVRIVGSPSKNIFEIIVNDTRTEVSKKQLRFLK